jgi:Fe-S oxidoreductase
MDRAQNAAAGNVAKLTPYAKQGYEIVSIEPTATYCLTVSYPRLLKQDDRARLIADKTHELFEYLNRIEAETGKTLISKPLKGRRFGFHCPCHQRSLNSGSGAMEWLRRRGAEVELIETGTCCGMGGTFGLKAGLLGHKLSLAVGDALFELFKNAEIDAIVTESSVCKIQLLEGTGIEVFHPLQIL